MTIKEKKEELAKFIEANVLSGYSITEYMGKPLSYYDFEKIRNRRIFLQRENEI